MSDVNWWLMLLSFLLGAVITWFWMVRRASREVPRTDVDRTHSGSGSVGSAAAGVGAGVAGVGGAALGAAALRDRDSDVADLDGATTRRADLDGARPTTELYDRTADEPSSSWEAPGGNAPDVDAPDVDAQTTRRSSLDAPEPSYGAADEVEGASFERSDLDEPGVSDPELSDPNLDAPAGEPAGAVQGEYDWDAAAADLDTSDGNVLGSEAADSGAPQAGGAGLGGGAGLAGGAAAAGVAGAGAAAWSSRSDDAGGEAAGERVRFAEETDGAHASSDAEIIEAESGLETPAAPTGEADWDSSGAEAGTDPGSADIDQGQIHGGPTSSVVPLRDAADGDDGGLSSAGAVGVAGAAGAAGSGIAAGRFGEGSADAGSDGSGPDGWAVKGNANSMLFHTEDSPAYSRTKAEIWFRDEESARRAGFTKWDERSR